MEDGKRRGIRSRLRWTLGSVMIVVAVFAFISALSRPFLLRAPETRQVIGIDFILEKHRLPDGTSASGFAPKLTITKQGLGTAKASRP